MRVCKIVVSLCAVFTILAASVRAGAQQLTLVMAEQLLGGKAETPGGPQGR
jgi:hypothetical protein